MSNDLIGNPVTTADIHSAFDQTDVNTSSQVMNEGCTSTACGLNEDLSALSANFTRLRNEINALFPANSTPDHVRTAVANGHRSVHNTVQNAHHLQWERCHRRNQPIQGVLEKEGECPVPAGDKAPASCYRQ